MNEEKSTAPEGSPKSVFKNTGALFILQIANYILPFVLLPYLTRTLGVELFGVVAFGLAISQIAYVITDYGFSLSATYLIAKSRDDARYVREVVGAAFLIKIFLILLVAAAMAGYLLVDSKYEAHHTYLWLMLLTVVGQAFQPIWFFQGMERMANITAYHLTSRLLYVGFVFLWVRGPSDYLWVAGANGLSHIVAAVIGLVMLAYMNYLPVWPGLRFIRQVWNHSTEFFWSRAAVSTYAAGATFFLGLVSTPIQVAYYSAAEQLYRGGQSVFMPLAQALYPYMAKHRNYALLFRLLRWCTVIAAIGIVFGLYAGSWLLQFIFGTGFEQSYPILIVFLVTLGINIPSVLLGYPFLGALGVPSLANRSVMYGGAIQVGLLALSFMMGWTSAVWVACTVLCAEVVVLGLRSFWGWRCFVARVVSPTVSDQIEEGLSQRL